jgi:hypothetical protein
MDRKGRRSAPYGTRARFLGFGSGLGLLLCTATAGHTEDLQITPNVPIPEFQNRPEDTRPYNFDAPPEGMFRSILTAQGYEEEPGFRRTHEIVPVNPSEIFPPDASAVYIVFQLHQHYQFFKVFGLCFPESVEGLDPKSVVTRDVMQMVSEDESGYLQLLPPHGGWKPGRYKVEIYAGEAVNDVTMFGTVRFSISTMASSNAQ